MELGRLESIEGKLVVPEWRGLRHGFFGKEAPSIDLENRTIAGLPLILVNQVHGAELLDFSDNPNPLPEFGSRCDADGILFSLDSRSVGYGVKTADCLPIILLGERRGAVVHAGWRGLAAGIIARAVEGLGEISTAAIGPAAGECHYEVGEEVVSKVPLAKYREGPATGKFMLNLAETAAAQIRQATNNNPKIYCTDICTIHTPSYHSARREVGSMGRNISAVWFTAQ